VGLQISAAGVLLLSCHLVGAIQESTPYPTCWILPQRQPAVQFSPRLTCISGIVNLEDVQKTTLINPLQLYENAFWYQEHRGVLPAAHGLGYQGLGGSFRLWWTHEEHIGHMLQVLHDLQEESGLLINGKSVPELYYLWAFRFWPHACCCFLPTWSPSRSSLAPPPSRSCKYSRGSSTSLGGSFLGIACILQPLSDEDGQ
jgi:hypothetical protein